MSEPHNGRCLVVDIRGNCRGNDAEFRHLHVGQADRPTLISEHPTQVELLHRAGVMNSFPRSTALSIRTYRRNLSSTDSTEILPIQSTEATANRVVAAQHRPSDSAAHRNKRNSHSHLATRPRLEDARGCSPILDEIEMGDMQSQSALTRQHKRISLRLLLCLTAGATIFGLAVVISKHGVLAEKRVTVNGNNFALWLEEEGDEVWVSAQQNPGWISDGAFSTSVFVAADSKTAAAYGPEFFVPVVPRSRWNQAEIHIDRQIEKARLVLDDAEIEFDFRDLSFSDPRESTEAATR